jgi:hypothetical protein
MIRLTSRVVQPPASGVPARNHKVWGNDRQETRCEPMSVLCFSLAGAKPGSASANGQSGLLFATKCGERRTNDIDVEAERW